MAGKGSNCTTFGCGAGTALPPPRPTRNYTNPTPFVVVWGPGSPRGSGSPRGPRNFKGAQEFPGGRARGYRRVWSGVTCMSPVGIKQRRHHVCFDANGISHFIDMHATSKASLVGTPLVVPSIRCKPRMASRACGCKRSCPVGWPPSPLPPPGAPSRDAPQAAAGLHSLHPLNARPPARTHPTLTPNAHIPPHHHTPRPLGARRPRLWLLAAAAHASSGNRYNYTCELVLGWLGKAACV